MPGKGRVRASDKVDVGHFSLQVLVEPGDGFFLGLIAGFVVDAVVLDVFDRHQFLHPGGPLMGEDGVVLVVEQLFLLGDDEQLGDVLASADVLDRGIADELLYDRCTRERAKSFPWLWVTNCPRKCVARAEA